MPPDATPEITPAQLAGTPALGANVNLNRVRKPSIAKAIRAISRHSWKGAELERDLSQATRALVPWNSRGKDDDDESDGDYANSLTLPTTRDAYLLVLEETGIKTPTSEFGKYAVRAMGQDA